MVVDRFILLSSEPILLFREYRAKKNNTAKLTTAAEMTMPTAD
jgi:hypothetical protein